MIEAVLLFGFVVFMGFALILLKAPKRVRIWLLSHPMIVDITVTVVAAAMHWGTMTGLMAAAMAGLMCALATNMMRWAAGYKENGQYKPGAIWNLETR